VTANSDDPAYFGGYAAENFRAVSEAIHLTDDEIYRLARNSFEASFLTEEEKRGYMGELEAFRAKRRQHT
jgi:adenosine deaminase